MAYLRTTSSQGLAITNPLVLYRALLATKQIESDPAQHRLALHLQKLYFRLKDYAPEADYSHQLEAIRRKFGTPPVHEQPSPVAVRSHPLRRNPLLSHLFLPKERRDRNALVRVLTSQEAAINLQSPRGLLLHGEVGTGKSMLVDLLADSLPNPKKQRWHFNTFMLETLSRLETLRRSRRNGADAAEYSLLFLAKDLIDTSPILFLDEFQLPDRAASKILSNLFTIFFQLGGVLIATSNRIPDELAKAAGVEFTPPPRSYAGRLLAWAGPPPPAFAGNAEFAGFLALLKARCEIWDMEGDKDWRRRDANVDEASETSLEADAGCGPATRPSESEDLPPTALPEYFVVPSKHSTEIWRETIRKVVPDAASDDNWESCELSVYGRTLKVPRRAAGVMRWTFGELCEGVYGPADYLTLASRFHTLILEDVPVLTVQQKNEARRLITLLDALYEARCKLVISADAGPDDLFFPETTRPEKILPDDALEDDATYAETVAEVYQDQTSPFRPNVSSYGDGNNTDFKTDDELEKEDASSQDSARVLNFGMTSAFTGEDERFAYKRARSRLWEMCGSRWHARDEPGWWRPLPVEVRQWERPAQPHLEADPLAGAAAKGDVQMGPSEELDEHTGLAGQLSRNLHERERF